MMGEGGGVDFSAQLSSCFHLLAKFGVDVLMGVRLNFTGLGKWGLIYSVPYFDGFQCPRLGGRGSCQFVAR